MAQAVPVPASTPIPLRIPLREVLPWVVFAGAILLSLLYLVGLDQGATSVFSGQLLHEFMHDGRHLLGVPCH